ncbi:histidine kinase [Mycobacterium sherrisii]|uniref:histidine kinase n=1 Tax=Mycobacterium sherrisii TaxID=243061 RepID=A0A1E3SV09_9MYCO|nr:histidine kinase [Mycobacterium sherrisii]
MTKTEHRSADRLGAVLLSGEPSRALVGLVTAVGCIAAETAVMLLLKLLVPGNAFGVLYLIGVLIVASRWGPGLAVLTALLSAIAYNYFRSSPDYGMALTQPQSWAVLCVFVVVGLVAQSLARTARVRAAAAEERRQEAETSREALRVLAEQQAALRRVATLVASGVPAAEVFPAVTRELARSLGVANAALWRYETDGTATLLAACNDPEQSEQMPIGTSWRVEGQNIAAMVAASGQPARMDSHERALGDVAALIRRLGLRGGAGAPIMVQGRLWGVAVVGSGPAEVLPRDAEQRVGEFTELVATAIANAEARAALGASRARIVTAADQARRRIERDLHDGAQQRLISLTLQLRSIEAEIPSELGCVKHKIADAVAGLVEASNDLRELARGIHPAILSRGGLGPALKVLARRSTVPVTLALDLQGNISESAGVAAYYVVAEAITNAVRHARGTGIDVDAGIDGADLVLSIRDDGVGGADSRKGSGLIGLIDRVEALGGNLQIVSPPGGGTIVHVSIPTGTSE